MKTKPKHHKKIVGNAIPFHIKHLHKPYRLHHVTLAGFSLFLCMVSLLYFAILHVQRADLEPVTQQAHDTLPGQNITAYQSDLGFTVSVNTDIFSVYTNADVAEEAGRSSGAFSRLEVLPKPGAQVPTQARAAQLTFTSDDSFVLPQDNYELISEEAETINEVEFHKQIYRYRFEDNGTPASQAVYTILWANNSDESRHTIALRGLIESPSIPHEFGTTINSFQIGQTLGLQSLRNQQRADWVDRNSSTRQYVSDLVSPAVVKLYHLVCATVKIENDVIPEPQCRAMTGSGFFVSKDGYIATNGHVVVYEPVDALADALLKNPTQFTQLLQAELGLSSTDVNSLHYQPEELAVAISRLYDLPEDFVSFDQEEKVVLAAIGSTPLLPSTDDELRALFSFKDTVDVKRATLVTHDFSGRDQIAILSGQAAGFSKRDVALLKVSVEDAPLISLASPVDSMPGQQITILGFPGDAENELVDTTELVVSSTLGSISSVRTAAGGEGTLLQTDTDASQGNSGGPAVTSAAKAIGLLTYRYKDDTTQNAAKSYLRDIADLRALLAQEDITLNVNSTVQKAWDDGLEAYAKGHFRRALHQFEQVKERYPAHRLAESYMQASAYNIDKGLDRSAEWLYIAGFIGGIGALGASTRSIVHHHRAHKAHLREHTIEEQPSN